MELDKARSFLVFPAEVSANGGRLDRGSVAVQSGAGSIEGRTFDGWIRFRSPSVAGTTVIAFTYAEGGVTRSGTLTVSYS